MSLVDKIVSMAEAIGADIRGLNNGKVDKELGKGLIEPAPDDGKTYVRSGGAWAEIDYVAPVTKNFEGLDPIDNNLWAPTGADFPDTTKVYQGFISNNDLTYKARYYSIYGGWIVEMDYAGSSGTITLVYIELGGMAMSLAAPIGFSTSTNLPAGLNRFSGTGFFDYRGFLGIPGATESAIEITLDIAAGHADVLLETPLYSSGDVSVETEPVFQTILGKLGTVQAVPADLYALLDMPEAIFGYGFTKGAKYWEVNRESDDGYKLTVKSASNEAHSVKFSASLY